MLVRNYAPRFCRSLCSRSFTSCQVILRDEPHRISVTTTPPPPVVSNFKLTDLPKRKASKEPKAEAPVSKATNSINLNGKAIELPPMMSYIRDVIDQYPGYIVLTQVGSFYELYFEQASEIAPLLRLTLTRREFKDYAIPMSGFPLGQLQKYISILVQDLQRGVVIVDQFKKDTAIDNDPQQFGRKVSRIITPGTLIDELFLDEQSNNFLLAIKFPEKLFTREPDPDAHVGLCWTDLSVGTLYVQETRLDDLVSSVNRLHPVEILVDDDVPPELLNTSQWHKEFSHFQQYLVKYVKAKRHKTIEEYFHMFEHGNSALKRSFQEFTAKEIASLRSVLQYIENHLPDSPISLEIPQKQYPQNILHIDTRTSEALELHRSLRERFLKGSLFSSIKRTVTPGGARLLAQWLSAPSRDLKELKKRQKIVLTFAKNSPFRADIILTLSQIHDLNRIVQRLSFGRGSPLELVQLAHSLQLVDVLKEKIEEEMESSAQAKRSLTQLLDNYVSKSHLSEEILKDLDEEAILLEMKVQEEELKREINPAVVEKKGRNHDTRVELQYIVREEASPILMRLHKKLRQLESEKIELQHSLNTRLVDTGKFKEASLKVTLGSDYLIHVRGGTKSPFNEIESLLPNALETSRGKLARWLDMKEWRVLGQSIDSTIFRIKAEEQNVIKELRRKVISNSMALRQIARTMEYIDVLSSFATLTVEKDLVCPKLDQSLELDIRRGRHLVVEEGLKFDLKNFTPNSCSLIDSKSKWVITGPNMGGKSTFLRQNAIIVIMAQMGCFVPAESARIGLVDKIFSRVGFGDDLYNQMSTFMVEMVETNYILQGATKRSLAILDEVGRGTSGREGVALAYVTLFHLLKVNGCRVLFATHFGKEIASLLKRDGVFDNFVFKKTGVVEVNGDVVIKHDLQDGITEKSYAINVAQLAGYSPGLVQKAHDVLNYMESNSIL
ncbi:MSH1 [Cyberlindnera jadinii]|uniref:MSH1 protein n=1 Tax=Cyberlindnera jadinii (strain ATCC 18201 / CBS 1600 / BCRC 20928 / JCM 3617 / NBRC 0987 / NRRL Y-1542) TaxID=983966 RepID=A0A0H5C6L7_CYBJN|nr:MSH1 [Cyberlindnera jadinii]